MQNPPIKNNSIPIVDQHIEDLKKRKELGIQRYGVPLQANNGRDALQDAYEEATDLSLYLKQAMIERNTRVKVKFAKRHPNAVIPKQARYGDAAFDLTAISYNYEPNADVPYYNYNFGLSVEIPYGYVGLIFPRSSISNKDVMLTNCTGVIDSGFRGELTARFKTTHFKGELPKLYKAGERVAQIMFIKLPEIEIEEVAFEQLSNSERGEGGFGSTN